MRVLGWSGKCGADRRELGTDIMHLKVGDRDYVVLGTREAITELMEKQSSNYSDRYVPSVLVPTFGICQR